jgi:flagellar motility protein MotE (MotC chaperone)
MSEKNAGRAGTLLVLVALLLGSALLRIGDETGKAIAKGIEPAAAPDPAAPAPLSRSEADQASELLSVLRTRTDELDAKARRLEDRAKAIELSERHLNEKIAALVEAEENLRATLALADGASEEDLARLTSVYEAMKPKQAAPLFEEMTPEFAAGFLGRMRPDAAAEILANMRAPSAYAVSVILAGRNATVPQE